MKKLQLLLMLIAISYTAHSQSFFFREGKNFTKFKFENSQAIPKNLHSDVGNSYEIGYSFPFKQNLKFHYELGLEWYEMNSYLEAPDPAVKYNVNYLGLNNALLYSIIKSSANSSRFILDLKGGINIHKYLQGKEDIFGKTNVLEVNDLRSWSEFNGLIFSAALGVHSKFIVNDFIDLSLGYDRSMTLYNSGNTSTQSLSFTGNHFKAGIHFKFN